jgi:hypothetical protein
MTLIVTIYALKMVDIKKNLNIFICLLKKSKLQKQNFAKFRIITRTSTVRNSVEFRVIFTNSVPYTECTEVKKVTGFRVDGIP